MKREPVCLITWLNSVQGVPINMGTRRWLENRLRFPIVDTWQLECRNILLSFLKRLLCILKTDREFKKFRFYFMNSNLGRFHNISVNFKFGAYIGIWEPQFGIPKTISFNYLLFILEYYKNCVHGTKTILRLTLYSNVFGETLYVVVS